MKLEIITETLTNLDIAERQLDRSIQLFLDEKDFISSLTLAGAAEEILGKILNKKDESNSLSELIEICLQLNGISNDSSTLEVKKAKKGIANMLNFYKNKAKHYNDTESLTFSVDFFAAEIIERAMDNYWKHTKKDTYQMKRFKNKILST
ncbi:conserved hypothetical protein [Pseudoalteromonas sp. 3J6]|uniref:hypothetical protein n=1 Tax=Pseudoalteromonas sp. 3J6 TaxID=649161 RepID=UPI001753F32A|nr:hypothetical protein [Pseudoalteromonas sp. 3J6]CAD2224835.1 conserved hypothetical protein [Pseudoalteromonas sp. 3J6]